MSSIALLLYATARPLHSDVDTVYRILAINMPSPQYLTKAQPTNHSMSLYLPYTDIVDIFLIYAIMLCRALCLLCSKPWSCTLF